MPRHAPARVRWVIRSIVLRIYEIVATIAFEMIGNNISSDRIKDRHTQKTGK